MSNYSLRDIENALQAALAPFSLSVLDESAAHAGHAGNPDGSALSHIRIQIASMHFVGLNTVAQHRLVYAALAPFIAEGLHAIVIESSVPAARG